MAAMAGKGWELLVTRLGMHERDGRQRTYGTYQVFMDGNPMAGLKGHMCECAGPGDNQREGNGRRVEAGRYPLTTQFGRYRSIGYADDDAAPGADPMPALALADTAARTGILIHPAHPPTLFLSSTGCFNPTGAVGAGQDMDFRESRARVIALIDSLRRLYPAAFRPGANTPIPHAAVVVEGEPTAALA